GGWLSLGGKSRQPEQGGGRASGGGCGEGPAGVWFAHLVANSKLDRKVAMVPETQPSMNSKSVKPRITRHPDGIFAAHTEYPYPGHAAVHISRHNGRAAFVDTGTNNSVPFLLAALAELDIPRDAVDYVFLTHVHMDHAGGAGLLARELPKARVLVHPRGTPHM